MTEIQNKKYYDLEDRTLEFSKKVIFFCNKLKRNIENLKLIDQVARYSGFVGANYIEANEALGRKDFLMRIRISRKESKESKH